MTKVVFLMVSRITDFVLVVPQRTRRAPPIGHPQFRVHGDSRHLDYGEPSEPPHSYRSRCACSSPARAGRCHPSPRGKCRGAAAGWDACHWWPDRHPKGASAARRSEATATPIRARYAVPMPWGAKPKQDTLRGVVTSFDLDGRCSYAATHKYHSAAWHWSRCIVVDQSDIVVQWEDTVHMPLADLIRCERCAVGIHPACAIDYSAWSGGPGKRGGGAVRRQARHS